MHQDYLGTAEQAQENHDQWLAINPAATTGAERRYQTSWKEQEKKAFQDCQRRLQCEEGFFSTISDADREDSEKQWRQIIMRGWKH